MKSFSERVYNVVRQIPVGFVSTYGEIAIAAGKPRAARAVGYALHHNSQPIITPCHRVVFKDGSLTDGFAFGGKEKQRELLESEGVIFLSDGKVDMAKCRFIGVLG